MADKTKEKGEKNDTWSFILDMIKGRILDSVAQGVKKLVHQGQKVLYHTQEKIVQALIAGLLLLFGLIMVLISVAMLISHYLEIYTGWMFLVIGIGLSIIALIMRDVNRKTKYYKF